MQMTPASPPEDGRPSSVAASHVNQNVETIAALYARAEDSLSHHQKIVERLTTWVGRPAAFYSILLLGSIWIAANVVMLGLGAAPPDPPPFFWLQGFVTFSALLVATMVLTTQNRQAKQAERRAQLDLQINLMAEQKVTKLISLLEKLRRDLPIVRRDDPVANAMAKTIDPHAVIAALEDTFDAPTERDDPATTARKSASKTTD